MKIPLQRAKSYPRGYTHHAITAMKPFFQRAPGYYVHRPRSARYHVSKGEVTHISISHWCGGNGFLSNEWKSGKLFDAVPEGEVLCATCEGKAIGAGVVGAREINGRPVMYSPRRRYDDIPLPLVAPEDIPEIKIEIRRRDTGELVP